MKEDEKRDEAEENKERKVFRHTDVCGPHWRFQVETTSDYLGLTFSQHSTTMTSLSSLISYTRSSAPLGKGALFHWLTC